MTDQELKDLVAGLAVSQSKTDAALASLAAAQARTDAQLAKTDAQLAKTDAQLAKTDAQLAKTDAQLAKTNAQHAKTEALVAALAASHAQSDARLDKVSARLDAVGLKLNAVAEMLGGVANSNGEVTEEFFYNSLKRDPNIGTIHFDQIKSNVVFKEDGVKKAELDILMLNGQCAAVIEVKHRPQKKDVEQLLKTVSYYKTTLPKEKQGKKYKIYGGIAGFSVPRSIVNLAKDNGLFILKQSGLVISSQTEAMTGF